MGAVAVTVEMMMGVTVGADVGYRKGQTYLVSDWWVLASIVVWKDLEQIGRTTHLESNSTGN